MDIFARARPYLPWASLVSGIAGGLLMDRDPRRAGWVLLISALGWAALLVFRLLAHSEKSHSTRDSWHVGRWISRWLTQQGTQLLLFFALPFYVRAAAPVWGHAVFLGAIGLAAGLTLWDPLYQAIVHRPLAGALLQAVATLAGLGVVLPMLGLANGVSLTVAAAITGAVLPCTVLTSHEPRRMLYLLAAGGVAVGLVALESSGWLGAVMPAAPLRMSAAAIGTEVVNMELRDATTEFALPPARLACFTRIWAPRGVQDALYHVWQHNGREVDRIALPVHGGREQGFRTWSVKQHLGPGAWVCLTVTQSNQILGRAAVLIR